MQVKALTFDTGGTILDWYVGVCGASQWVGQAHLNVAQWMGMEPSEIVMVACHNFNLNAVRARGFKTASFRRSNEWGPEGPPDPTPHPDCDIVAHGFDELAKLLDV